MSICGFSGNQISVVYQRSSRLMNEPSRKSLLFLTTSLKAPFLCEIIKNFHELFLQKTQFLQNSEKMSSEEVVKYLHEYCNDIITQLYSFNRKSIGTSSSLPYKEMGLFLRTIQSFLLSSTVSNSILKLNKEYEGEQRGQDIRTFDLSLFYKCLKSGNLEDALSVVRKHPQINSPRGSHIESCLNPASRVFGLLYYSENEFLQHFEAISLESQNLAKLCESDNGEFRAISRLLAGSVDDFMKLRPTWLEYLIYHCLFIEGIVYDQETLAQTLAQKFPLGEFDELLLKVMFGNLHSAVQQAGLMYPSFFMCHVVDILSSVSKLPSESRTEFEGLNYPEFYFYNYVREIISSTEIPVYVPCDYIFYNLGGLENFLEIMNQAALIRLPNGNIEEMIQYFHQRNLPEIAQNIHKAKAMECLQKNEFGTSLHWALSSGLPELKYKIEKCVIDIAVQSPHKWVKEILNSVPAEMKTESSVIYFFSQYMNYLKAIDSREVTRAGEMLVAFFLHDTAPEEFYESILVSAIPLFEQGLVLSYSNFLKVLKAYEKVANTKLRHRPAGAGVIEKLSGVLAYSGSLSMSLRSNDR